VWLDTGSASLRQANFDGTGILTLSTDAVAFASASSTFDAPITLGAGIVLLATNNGVYKATLNAPNTNSQRLMFTNTPAG
jgi:hypothetical protein